MGKGDFSKALCNFTEITLQHGCSPENLLHIFRTNFSKNISQGLLPHTINFNLSGLVDSVPWINLLAKQFTSSGNSYKLQNKYRYIKQIQITEFYLDRIFQWKLSG